MARSPWDGKLRWYDTLTEAVQANETCLYLDGCHYDAPYCAISHAVRMEGGNGVVVRGLWELKGNGALLVNNVHFVATRHGAPEALITVAEGAKLYAHNCIFTHSENCGVAAQTGGCIVDLKGCVTTGCKLYTSYTD